MYMIVDTLHAGITLLMYVCCSYIEQLFTPYTLVYYKRFLQLFVVCFILIKDN